MKIAAVFSDNMVLQRGRNIRVFGSCTDSEKAITVTLYAFETSFPARAVIKNGTWEAVLPPIKECSSCTLEVSCGAVKKVFSNVAIGEVWLAGGQSNMEFELHNDKNGEKELEKCSEENVRYFYTPKCPIESELAEAEKNTGWTTPSAKNSAAWSAVGYYFAKELSRRLGVTVGIIGCNWGGTSASAWMPRKCSRNTMNTANIRKTGRITLMPALRKTQTWNGIKSWKDAAKTAFRVLWVSRTLCVHAVCMKLWCAA